MAINNWFCRRFQFGANWLLFNLIGGLKACIKILPFVNQNVFLNGLFSFIFVFSNKHYNLFSNYMWKNVHPVYSAEIWTNTSSVVVA